MNVGNGGWSHDCSIPSALCPVCGNAYPLGQGGHVCSTQYAIPGPSHEEKMLEALESIRQSLNTIVAKMDAGWEAKPRSTAACSYDVKGK